MVEPGEVIRLPDAIRPDNPWLELDDAYVQGDDLVENPWITRMMRNIRRSASSSPSAYMMTSVRKRVADLERTSEVPPVIAATDSTPCVECGKPGHTSPQCPKRKSKAEGRFAGVRIKIAMFSKNPDVVIGYFLLDSACAKTVGGEPWKEAMVLLCEKYGIPYSIAEESEPFRFGPGKRMYSKCALLLPVIWGPCTAIVRISIVEKDVPCLLSRPAMGLLSMVLDMANNSVTIGAMEDTVVSLRPIETGHVAIPVFGTESHRPQPTDTAFQICREGREVALADETLEARVAKRFESIQHLTLFDGESEESTSDSDHSRLGEKVSECRDSTGRDVPYACAYMHHDDSSDGSGGLDLHHVYDIDADDELIININEPHAFISEDGSGILNPGSVKDQGRQKLTR